MANEAVLQYETELPIPFTVSNTVTIEKGSLLALYDPITASGSYGVNDPVAGIAASEKIANDGVTKLAVYRGGIFKVYLSGACTAGDILILAESGNNYVRNLNLAASGSSVIPSGCRILGYALETGAVGESILCEVTAGR